MRRNRQKIRIWQAQGSNKQKFRLRLSEAKKTRDLGKDMSRIIRETKQTDIADIMKVMEAAKKIMRSSGNMHQWGEGYPSEAVITSDMEKNGGFVIEDEGRVVGYFAFLPSPEPTYQKIYDGKWLDDELPWQMVGR